ncbi:Hypothetical protein HDN1F_19070 [gamma proteobacterium HdN1]|nr:Hypothetical protein HDN1F_19070 [gamma proteobacterium HdN1]
MNFSSVTKMPFSTTAVWPSLDAVDPRVKRAFWAIVVPMSLLPPVMVYLAGAHHGEAFLSGASSKSWGYIAAIFFVCELLSVGLMGWLAKAVATTWNGKVSYGNAYLLAAISPIPLWFSSLGLLVPSLAFNAAVSMIALAVSCALVFQGVRSLCHIKEELEAAVITQIVFGAGMLVWGVLLLLLVILPG